MLGKDICKVAREMRKQIANENGIVYLQSECHKLGDCDGSCSITEAETRWLNNEIQRNLEAGKKFTLPNFKFFVRKTDIKHLNLGKKTMKVLREAKIDTIEELQAYAYEGLEWIPNINESQICHIYERLDEYNIETYEYQNIFDINEDDLPF